MEESGAIFRPAASGECLRQGEIISDLVQFRLRLEAVGGEPSGYPVSHPYAVLITQDCDLEQDFRVRRQGDTDDVKLLPGLLFCEVSTAEELFGRLDRNRKLWERIPKNKDERYHYLQRAEAVCDACRSGLPELGIDFKRYFTIPTDEVYRRIELGEARRRSVLVSPYLEHLSGRFAYFLSRIALPSDHTSE